MGHSTNLGEHGVELVIRPLNLHEHIIRRIQPSLVEHEMEGGKLVPEKVLYMTPEELNKGGKKDAGARCGKCAFFNETTSNCLITSPSKCSGAHGVCGLFVGGDFVGGEPKRARAIISKKTVGYIEDKDNVPTRCGNCEYFSGEGETGNCEKVGGTIYRDGCCNGWEPKPKEEEANEPST